MTATKVETPVTERGTIVGTFHYMSPEQVEGRELDGRSDIFSLGTVLYEMTTGQRAFKGKSRLSVASAILEKEPAPITTLKPLAPVALDHAIRTCLEKDPEDRWQTARDLSHELKWIAEAGSQAGAPVVRGRGSRIMRERIAWAIAAILLCALAAVGAIAFHLKKDAAPSAAVVRAMIPPPADNQFPGGSMVLAISPDGRQVVVTVRDNQGKRALWLRSLNDAGEGRILPGTDGGNQPFWSPDNRSIGFFAGDKLKRIDIEENLVQVLADATTRCRGGTWSPNGIIVFAPDQSTNLYQVPASGGTPRQLTALNKSHTEQTHRWPVFLPDGKHFLFFARSQQQPELSGIYAGSLDSKEYQFVVGATAGPAFASGGSIVYMRNGVVLTQAFDERQLAVSGEPVALRDHVEYIPLISFASFSVSPAGDMVYYPAPVGAPGALSWYDRDGKRGDTLGIGYSLGIALSPDGTRAVATIANSDGPNTDLWNFDLSRGTKTRLTSRPETKQYLAWQPDGQFVLFGSGFLDNPFHIYRTRSDGSAEIETVLNSEGISEFPGSVCRDGRYLAYWRTPKDSQVSSIWILPLMGDRKPFPLVQSQFSNQQSGFSPDCKWVAYTSNATGQSEVYLTHFPDATRTYQVSTRGGTNPRWRSDGKELFYVSPVQNDIMAVDVNEKTDEISLGNPRTLFHIANIVQTSQPLGVTPDGQRFLIVTTNYPPGPVPLTLVTNWNAELKTK